jgi:SAM-dependent methyltransferase
VTVSAKWSTDGQRYADRLVSLQTAWWKRIVPVQAPYRWNLRRLRPGFTLEVGCGLGRNLAHLDGHGVGVDHNPELVAAARRRGLDAFTIDEFAKSEFARPDGFDSLLASHVVEHMTTAEATDVLAGYLPYVKPSGQVIVLTPQERGYTNDPSHVSFATYDEVRAMFASLGLDTVKQYSFPLPRAFGRVFVYNEFVSVAKKP